MSRLSLKRMLQQTDKRRIVVGEIHGVEENVDVVKKLVSSIGVRRVGLVAFEYPKELEGRLKNAGRWEELREDSRVKMMREDGRFSKLHYKLVRWLGEKGVEVVCLDNSKRDWNRRDKLMYETFKQAEAEKNEEQYAIAVLGNLHTRKKSFVRQGEKHIPFASYIKNQVNIRLVYLSGYYYNHGLKEFPVKKQKNKELVEISTDTYEYYIKEATPTKKEEREYS